MKRKLFAYWKLATAPLSGRRDFAIDRLLVRLCHLKAEPDSCKPNWLRHLWRLSWIMWLGATSASVWMPRSHISHRVLFPIMFGIHSQPSRHGISTLLWAIAGTDQYCQKSFQLQYVLLRCSAHWIHWFVGTSVSQLPFPQRIQQMSAHFSSPFLAAISRYQSS